MPPVKLKLAILPSDRPQIHALDRTTTLIGCVLTDIELIFLILIVWNTKRLLIRNLVCLVLIPRIFDLVTNIPRTPAGLVVTYRYVYVGSTFFRTQSPWYHNP